MIKITYTIGTMFVIFEILTHPLPQICLIDHKISFALKFLFSNKNFSYFSLLVKLLVYKNNSSPSHHSWNLYCLCKIFIPLNIPLYKIVLMPQSLHTTYLFQDFMLVKKTCSLNL